MPRRKILSRRQRSVIFDLPTALPDLHKYYTLDDEDLLHIKERRGAHNRMGFALQLCTLRYPGRLLIPGEVIPFEVARYIVKQLEEDAASLAEYAKTDVTRRRHLIDLRRLYGFEMFSGSTSRLMRSWLADRSHKTSSTEMLLTDFVYECRFRNVILPGFSVIERLCADAMVAAERDVEGLIFGRLSAELTAHQSSQTHVTVWMGTHPLNRRI